MPMVHQCRALYKVKVNMNRQYIQYLVEYILFEDKIPFIASKQR